MLAALFCVLPIKVISSFLSVLFRDVLLLLAGVYSLHCVASPRWDYGNTLMVDMGRNGGG